MPLREDEDLAGSLQAKIDRGGELMQALAGIKKTDDSEAIIRAALRSVWVAAELGDMLVALEVPAELTDDERTAYCEVVHQRADHPRRLAARAAVWCRETADARGYAGPQIGACDDLLADLERPQ